MSFFVHTVSLSSGLQWEDLSTTTSSSASLSTRTIKQWILQLQRDRHRSSTWKNYYQIWKGFNAFYLKLDDKPDSWKEWLTLYVAFLINLKRKASTINSYISAIKAVLKDMGVEIHENRYLLTSLTCTCKIRNNQVKMKLPIQQHLLEQILIQIIRTFWERNQPYLLNLYLPVIAAIYYGLLHVGEVTTGNHPIKAKDVQIGLNKRKILFVLRTSKTQNQNNHPQFIKITSSFNNRNKRFCPYKLLKNYLTARPK